MGILATESIHKKYGQKTSAFQALTDISVDIKKGESIAIVGKSGSGKSTLMHILACLDRPTSGAVLFNGKSLSTYSQKELDKLRNRKFGFVFQQFFLNPNDTVIDNVALPLKLAGESKSSRHKKAQKLLEELDLADKAKQKARNLSGGQKQRVCIARALVNSPDVIFADEPTGNLDTANGEKVEQLLFDMNKDRNITLIIVTHDVDLAKKCSRQIILKDGQIVSTFKKGHRV